jgi:hypothetical protein
MLIKSAILSALSGSIAGATAAKNRGGTYFRSRVVPLNPQTSAQYEVRGNMAAAASAWSSLTDAQIVGWNAYAATLDGTNAVGDTKRLSGINAYTACNSLRLLGGLSQLAAFPTAGGKAVLTPPATATVDASDGATVVDITLTDGWAAVANGLFFFYYGDNVSDGTSFYKGPWHLGGFKLRGGSAPTDPAAFTIPEMIGTTKRFYRIRSIDSTGRVSPEVRGQLALV